MSKYIYCLFIIFLFSGNINAQSPEADLLRGLPNKHRDAYDVKYYELSIDFDIPNKQIIGIAKVFFTLTNDTDTLQIDLYENMQIDSIIIKQQKANYHRYKGTVYIPQKFNKDENLNCITVYYKGKPLEANRPPWDGGIVWSKDKKDRDFIGIAVEGDGASLWYPCKDLLNDKPDSVKITGNVPKDLMFVANGQFIESKNNKDKTEHTWFVSYPIVNYNLTFYIGNYTHIKDSMITILGNTLPLNYYVLDYNKEKAIKHFEQTKNIISSFEYYFGEYPFINDGYAIVEAPYSGMEHQSAIAYGNNYKHGYDGIDYSQVGLPEDFIILHETAHEWWGNAVSMQDLSDMWINEALATYAECLYAELNYGKEMYTKYTNGKRNYLRNDFPAIPNKYTNIQGSFDMYYKGALMFHSIRNIMQNDDLFFATLKNIMNKHKYQSISTEEFIKDFKHFTNMDYTHIFYEYLKHTNKPLLKYQFKHRKNNTIGKFKWISNNPDFNMPIEISINKNDIRQLNVSTKSTKLKISNPDKKNIELHKDNIFFFTK